MFCLILRQSQGRLMHLSWVDTAITAIYFLAALAIGYHLKERTHTGEESFLAGREMTAWMAGLRFLSANLGALELMGGTRDSSSLDQRAGSAEDCDRSE
jgi:solute:Na+ symporter, SSS family